MVRLASSEKRLDEFICLRPVILQLINCTEFDKLYHVTSDDSEKQQDVFIHTI